MFCFLNWLLVFIDLQSFSGRVRFSPVRRLFSLNQSCSCPGSSLHIMKQLNVFCRLWPSVRWLYSSCSIGVRRSLDRHDSKWGLHEVRGLVCATFNCNVRQTRGLIIIDYSDCKIVNFPWFFNNEKPSLLLEELFNVGNILLLWLQDNFVISDAHDIKFLWPLFVT